jgi:hypothetical protein
LLVGSDCVCLVFTACCVCCSLICINQIHAHAAHAAMSTVSLETFRVLVGHSVCCVGLVSTAFTGALGACVRAAARQRSFTSWPCYLC